MNDAIRMQISAFVDGELPDNEADLLLRRMGQDAGLRKQVAEYLAIGRAMRGETAVQGVDRIHERVSAAIDDKPFESAAEESGAATRGAIRPLAGVAVAAAVALAAIFGLQQTIGPDSRDAVMPAAAVTNVESGYTVPKPMDDQLRQYYLSHGAIATENGANGINSRFVSLRLTEEALNESQLLENNDSAVEAEDSTTQP